MFLEFLFNSHSQSLGVGSKMKSNVVISVIPTLGRQGQKAFHELGDPPGRQSRPVSKTNGHQSTVNARVFSVRAARRGGARVQTQPQHSECRRLQQALGQSKEPMPAWATWQARHKDWRENNIKRLTHFLDGDNLVGVLISGLIDSSKLERKTVQFVRGLHVMVGFGFPPDLFFFFN